MSTTLLPNLGDSTLRRQAAPAKFRVLIVDDEATMRSFIRRLLERDFDVDILDADDGLAALNRLLIEPVDLVLLDLSMPVISGIETLAAIRQSRTFAHLPVVVLTGQADEERVRRAMELGVRDVMAKPFTPVAFRDRVKRILARCLEARDHACQEASPDVALSDRMLVVDASAEFRAIVSHHFGRICAVESVENEFAALARCLASPIEFLVIGSTSELSSVETLARKVRATSALGAVKLIAAVPASEMDATKRLGIFDAVLVRSLTGFGFEHSLRQAFGERTLARLLMHPESSCISACFDAIRDSLGGVFGKAVTQHDAPPRALTGSRWVVASVELQCAGLSWAVRLRCPVAAGLEMVGANLAVETDELAGPRMMTAVSRIVFDLAKHVRGALLERGLVSQANLAAVDLLGAPGASPDAAETLGARRWYLTPHEGTLAIEVAPVVEGPG